MTSKTPEGRHATDRLPSVTPERDILSRSHGGCEFQMSYIDASPDIETIENELSVKSYVDSYSFDSSADIETTQPMERDTMSRVRTAVRTAVRPAGRRIFSDIHSNRATYRLQ